MNYQKFEYCEKVYFIKEFIDSDGKKYKIGEKGWFTPEIVNKLSLDGFINNIEKNTKYDKTKKLYLIEIIISLFFIVVFGIFAGLFLNYLVFYMIITSFFTTTLMYSILKIKG